MLETRNQLVHKIDQQKIDQQ